MLLTVVDTDAFLHVALYGLLAAVGLVVCFGGALIGFDRSRRAEGGGAASAAWLTLTALGGAACVGLLAVGLWAMTQKP
jgi:hypothetical protein